MPGALDGNGIWQYAESDTTSTPTFSALLNKLASSVSLALDALGLSNAAWTTVVPSFGNITVGNGTITGRVRKMGRTVTYMGSFVLGSTSAVSGNPTIVLPYAAIATYTGNQPIGTLGLLDFVTTSQVGWVRFLTTTAGVFMPGNGASMSATVPWTWTTGDTISWLITYESAA